MIQKNKVIDDMSEKGDIFHKIFLVNEFRNKGYESAIEFKMRNEIEFINSIKCQNPMDVIENLKSELFAL